MKVVMIARSNLYSTPGGDTTQIEMTAKHLRYLGVEVDIFPSDEKIDYKKYNLIHFFNIIRPDDILSHLHSRLPFVVSTIFVDYSEYEKFKRKGIAGLLFKYMDSGQIEYIKAIARFAINGQRIKSMNYLLRGHNQSLIYVAKKSGMLLPNSHSEYTRFSNKFHLERSYKKVVNAIDVELYNDTVLENEEFKNHILCVGRIEGLKNQLNLIRAMKDTNIPLTFIGKPAPNHIKYYNQCKDLASDSSQIKFIDHIPHRELPAIYKAARVHVLPSWFETTGLSSLEAAVMGCNVVITKKGDTEEYFEDMAYYCEPDDIASIKAAVLNAYQAPTNDRLRHKIQDNYNWKNAAEQTLEAYREVLASDV